MTHDHAWAAKLRGLDGVVLDVQSHRSVTLGSIESSRNHRRRVDAGVAAGNGAQIVAEGVVAVDRVEAAGAARGAGAFWVEVVVLAKARRPTELVACSRVGSHAADPVGLGDRGVSDCFGGGADVAAKLTPLEVVHHRGGDIGKAGGGGVASVDAFRHVGDGVGDGRHVERKFGGHEARSRVGDVDVVVEEQLERREAIDNVELGEDGAMH